MPYDYREAVSDDIREYIAEEYDFNDYISAKFDEYEGLTIDIDTPRLYADLIEDPDLDYRVTGSADNSYTCNRALAEEYVLDNEDLFVKSFGKDIFKGWVADNEYEDADMAMRHYLIEPVLNETLCDIVREVTIF